MRSKHFLTVLLIAACAFAAVVFIHAQSPEGGKTIHLPTSKLLQLPVPGHPQKTNSFPTALALSPDGEYLAILNNGYGTEQSSYDESIAVLDLKNNRLTDYPDARLHQKAHQTYFLGLAFSRDGRRLYASFASLTDPTGRASGDTGNGIAVYSFEGGKIAPGGFLKIPLQLLHPDQHPTSVSRAVPAGQADPYPAGIAVVNSREGERLLVADNLSDDALLLDSTNGKVLRRFDLSHGRYVPATFPYGVVATRGGRLGFCSLWNDSSVAELNLSTGQVLRRISLLRPARPTAPGSHPSALLLSRDEKFLYVALANADRVAVVRVADGKLVALLSTELPGEEYGGTYPNALAQSQDGKLLFAADAGSDDVAVFNTDFLGLSNQSSNMRLFKPEGFIPTEWYPTALTVEGGDLLVATGKGEGTTANALSPAEASAEMKRVHRSYTYIATLLHGSVARLNIAQTRRDLPQLSREVEKSNLMGRTLAAFHFAGGSNPIKHVIYIIKENRTYDQIFGDLKPGNGDPAITMYGWDITPNEHKLALQFGVLDNFYVSGEVSGNGHVWSMAAIDSDYTEKTWEIAYRSSERTYDYEGEVLHSVPLAEGIPDVDEPGTGYIWTNVARHGLTHRNYGEFVETHWCGENHAQNASPKMGTPLPAGEACPVDFVRKGQPLPANVGEPHGSPSPWPWPVPMIARDQATMPELVGHFDPRYADFRLDYPDQLRADEFLNEFEGFVKARKAGHGTELPQFIILRIPDDHTAGTKPGMPKPEASIADNDLAIGRVADAVSHSPYWNDTAIFILEDDAQDGPDHVDAHRSTALVISKYAQGSRARPAVVSNFYTTVNMVRTMEVLLGLPPMNNNDARAQVMAPLFAGPGNQPPFSADHRNQKNGLIYETNAPHNPGAKLSAEMDFTHADQDNPAVLNKILWQERKGKLPMPPPRHTVFLPGED
ncbi:MAG TPA: beta-propeller fold lactonase family protein [Terriglobia bacterium]|nr:beta-propeller fold lactonase family protein [Terriglobia bacterium]